VINCKILQLQQLVTSILQLTYLHYMLYITSAKHQKQLAAHSPDRTNMTIKRYTGAHYISE